VHQVGFSLNEHLSLFCKFFHGTMHVISGSHRDVNEICPFLPKLTEQRRSHLIHN